MIHTIASEKNCSGSQIIENESVEKLVNSNVTWFWVDFESPAEDEIKLLRDVFQFSHLAIEDCLEHFERPKIDHYDSYSFFVIHALDQVTLKPIELDLFLGRNYIVSFHKAPLDEIFNVRERLLKNADKKDNGHSFIIYLIFDKIVDQYFPVIYKIEDALNEIDMKGEVTNFHDVIDQVFEIRANLLRLGYTINSMKELLYRILNSERLESFVEKKRYFNDVYDHLLMLSETIETNREITSDIRDNYLSINSHKMNKIMTILTVISSIFIPLTFIAGVYGMNFDYMPELRLRYGYFIILGVMVAVGISMILWFVKKGWFDIKK